MSAKSKKKESAAQLPSFVRVERGDRRTVRISIGEDLTVRMLVPRRMAEREIVKLYYQKERWIAVHYERMRERVAHRPPPFTEAELVRCAEETRRALMPILEEHAVRLGVRYCRVSVRRQRSRYGSCSTKRNLNFNALLSLMPHSVLEYVAVHELCHLKHMNHSSAFWAEVERALPTYREARAWLKANGAAFLARLP